MNRLRYIFFFCSFIVLGILTYLYAWGGIFFGGGFSSFELEFFSNGRLFYDGYNHVIKDKWCLVNQNRFDMFATINDNDYGYLLDRNKNKIYIIGRNGLQVVSIEGIQIYIKEYPNSKYNSDAVSVFLKEKNYGNHFSIVNFNDFTDYDKQQFRILVENLFYNDWMGLPLIWREKDWPKELLIYSWP